MGPAPSEPVAAVLESLVAAACSRGSLPSLSAATFRAGQIQWQGSVGTDGGEGRQYRIGSLSKTFTAVLVLRLRDDGLLGLDDRLGRHLPDAPFGHHSIRQLLSHQAGITAEPRGSWWERTPGVSWPELAAANHGAGQIFPPGERYHYSNLGFGLLGELVARLRGGSWFDLVRAELLTPLGLNATSYTPRPDAAVGTSREPRSGLLVGEPAHDSGAMAAAGQLWSTIGDLARWGDFLVTGQVDVLAPTSLQEMRTVMSGDPDTQHVGAYGLGLRLRWHPSGTLVGHTGSMPGFLAALFVHPPSRSGAVVLTNATVGLDPEGMAVRLLDASMSAAEPTAVPSETDDSADGDAPEGIDPEGVAPEGVDPEGVDPEVRDLAGDWYWGNSLLRLQPDRVGFTLTTSDSERSFERIGRDRFVGRTGYFAGELLQVHRRSDDTVSHLEVVTFILTRQPYDPSAPIPGGPPVQLA